MPQHTHAPVRICPDCDGFARAAIDTGNRHPDGTRHTLTAHCTTCRGTGTTTQRTTAHASAQS
ncbi:hypothetical protein [Kitasatospora terrestris]|uniref:Small CPxCG-related zinc finger protein n=1 Tax=Kitasatospora terrestris TaxID=258051 RepID=A0ABP9DV44_9ACTN